jgi:hypothetical protein
VEKICNCLLCGQKLEGELGLDKFGEVITPLYGGVVWRTTGNYGSAVYDVMPSDGAEFIEAYICDLCMQKKAHLMYRVRLFANSAQVESVDHPDLGSDEDVGKDTGEPDQSQ